MTDANTNHSWYLTQLILRFQPDYEAAASITPVYAEKKRSKNTQQRKKQDDPYYCGLLARIPNFIKSSKHQCASKPKKEPKISRKISAQHHQFLLASQQQQQQQQPQATAPIPIATFHHSYFPYKLYPQQHRLSQSQLSLWDARSLISAHGRLIKIDKFATAIFINQYLSSSPLSEWVARAGPNLFIA